MGKYIYNEDISLRTINICNLCKTINIQVHCQKVSVGISYYLKYSEFQFSDFFESLFYGNHF